MKKLRDNNAPETSIMQFVRQVIDDHKSSDLYRDGDISDRYARQENVEAINREKLYRDIAGRLVKNNWTPCHRMRSKLFGVLATQENSFLLGNGLTLERQKNKEKLGKDFDTKLLQAGYAALTQTVSYLFWNLDHVEIFKNLEFAPLMDETTSSLRAGVRWWQITVGRPLRATLYEEDGYTEYVWNLDKDGQVNPNGEILQEKRGYQITYKVQPNEEVQITNQQNYPAFPIVPLWSNTQHINQFMGIKPTIDAIDELTNALNDDLTETQLYWLIQGADGMDKSDLAQLLRDIREQKIINPAEGQSVQPYTVNIPVNERQAEISRLKRQVYEDFQGLDIDEIKGGAVTATQIKAAYEPLNHKADDYEMCVIECLNNLFKLIPGLEYENPTFTRSMLINTTEQIQALELVKGTLGAEYVAEKELLLFGDGDKTAEIIERIKSEEMAMFMQNEQTEEAEQQPKEEE